MISILSIAFTLIIMFSLHVPLRPPVLDLVPKTEQEIAN